MREIILIFMVLTMAGCTTVSEYTGPTLPVSAQVPSGEHHRVEAGETLWKISKIYGVDIDEIIRVNRLSEEIPIEIGQVIIIPGYSRKPALPVVKSLGDDFIWPLKGRIISSFGSHYHNLANKGINIQAQSGSEVLATRSGRVVFYATNFGNYGKTVIIDHGDGLRSVYCRLSEIFVQPGENIQRGMPVGSIGGSVRDKNTYLHFEIRKRAIPQNPLFYLSG